MAIEMETRAPLAAAPVEMTVRQARTALWILTIVYVFNFVDRQILNILAEPIARDLQLSDTQIGLMTGLAFAAFYTILGIPLARYADNPKHNRVGLMAVCLAVWSGMTALSGLASNFWQLLAARVGVGAGEAGCTPAAISIIADIVPSHRRASAMGLYMMGVPIGSLLGMVIGGTVADAHGWRTAFLMVGLPGLLMALLLWIFVKEPRTYVSRLSQPRTGDTHTPLSLRAVAAELMASRAYVFLILANSVGAFLSYGKGVWTIIFFMRSHGLTSGQVGLWLGITGGLCGIFGSWLGGRIADRFGSKNPRHYFTAAIIGGLLSVPLYFFAYYSQDWRLALFLLCFTAIIGTLNYGSSMATTQAIFRPQARAMATAVKLFVQTLVGLGMGPLIFGMISDSLKPVAGDESVRWVLLSAAFLGFIPAFCLWRASGHLQAEMKYKDS